VLTTGGANTAVTALDTALDVINTSRAVYGAAMNRFSLAIQNLQITGENQAAARGRIVDADFAAETASLSRAQIMQQAGGAMVAQANQLPSQVLALLR
jgi:flagellin